MIGQIFSSCTCRVMPQVVPVKLTNLKSAWAELETTIHPERGRAPSVANAQSNPVRLKPEVEYRPPELISLRERIWNLFDDPGSSQAAQTIGLAMMMVIVVSSSSFVLQTVPELDRVDDGIWRMIEVVSVTIFTVEFSIRFLFCPTKRTFVRDPLNWVDFTAIVPFYLELIFTNSSFASSSVFRIVRLVRIFRVFKISRYVTWISVFYDAIKASVNPLGILLYIMSVAMVIFSTAMHYAERGEWDKVHQAWMRPDGTRSPYYSIPASFWWCIITMTTVGYGDDVPITAVGRFIAGITSLSGILVLAIPITIISANFNTELEKMLRQRDINFTTLQKLRDELERAYYNRAELEKKLVTGSHGAWSKPESEITDEDRRLFKQLGRINQDIKESRQKLTEFMEEQIKHILNKNMEGLMKHIGETVQRQKLISSNQIKSILTMVPRFVQEPNPWRHETAQWFQMMTKIEEEEETVAGDNKPPELSKKASLSPSKQKEYPSRRTSLPASLDEDKEK